jgi:hypothetical protein
MCYSDGDDDSVVAPECADPDFDVDAISEDMSALTNIYDRELVRFLFSFLFFFFMPQVQQSRPLTNGLDQSVLQRVFLGAIPATSPGSVASSQRLHGLSDRSVRPSPKKLLHDAALHDFGRHVVRRAGNAHHHRPNIYNSPFNRHGHRNTNLPGSPGAAETARLAHLQRSQRYVWSPTYFECRSAGPSS